MPLKPGTWSVDRASIDPAYDQLWSGLDFLLPLFEQTGERTHVYGKDAARFNRQQGDIPTAITRVPTEAGLALNFPIDRFQLATSYLAPAQGTWLWVGSFDNSQSGDRLYGSHDRFEVVSSKSTLWRIENNFYAAGGGVLLGPNTLAGDTVHVLVCTWNSDTNRLEIYYNGVLVASDSNADDTPTAATLWLGGRASTLFSGDVLLMAQWDRVLGAGDVQLIQADPFGMIREAQWPTWPALPVVDAGFDETVTDPVGVTDDTTRDLDYARDVIDAVGVTDTTTAAKTISVEISDAIGVTDDTSRVVDAARAIDDSVGVTDSTVKDEDNAETVTEPVGVADSTTRVHSATRTPTEALGVTDEALPAKAIAVTISDAVGVTDVVVDDLTAGVQSLRPDSDLVVAGWTPTPSSPTTLFDKIDEVTASDTDYISET